MFIGPLEAEAVVRLAPQRLAVAEVRAALCARDAPQEAPPVDPHSSRSFGR
jgi:hypothetical protein